MTRELNEINVIPLVDVMLVLLVIVLTTATFITTAQVPVDLAKASQTAEKQDTPVVLTLTKDGELYLNDVAVPRDGLASSLRGLPKASLVVVRADRAIVLDRFVGLVDEVRTLGFNQVSLEVVRS
jgi:biopolymer transport protein ExbD